MGNPTPEQLVAIAFWADVILAFLAAAMAVVVSMVGLTVWQFVEAVSYMPPPEPDDHD